MRRSIELEELAHYRTNATSHDPVFESAVAAALYQQYSDDHDPAVLAEIMDSCVLVDFEYLVGARLDIRSNIQRGFRKTIKLLDPYGAKRNTRITKTCRNCGTDYHPSVSNELKSEYCSRSCQHEGLIKAVCPQGHAYTPENTYRKGNKKQCRTCMRERSRARKRAARMLRLAGDAA
jgi:hypothetical protein